MLIGESLLRPPGGHLRATGAADYVEHDYGRRARDRAPPAAALGPSLASRAEYPTELAQRLAHLEDKAADDGEAAESEHGKRDDE